MADELNPTANDVHLKGRLVTNAVQSTNQAPDYPRFLPKPVHEFVFSRLDYSNDLYLGLPEDLVFVQNAAASLLTNVA